jgi:hypothetical protein
MNKFMPVAVAAIIVVLVPSITSANPIVTEWEIEWRDKYWKEHLKKGEKPTEAQKWQMQTDMMMQASKRQPSVNAPSPGFIIDRPHPPKQYWSSRDVRSNLILRPPTAQELEAAGFLPAKPHVVLYQSLTKPQKIESKSRESLKKPQEALKQSQKIAKETNKRMTKL